MFGDYVVTVDRQDSWYCEACFDEETLKLFKPVNCDDAEDVGENIVKSIDDIEKMEEDE